MTRRAWIGLLSLMSVAAVVLTPVASEASPLQPAVLSSTPSPAVAPALPAGTAVAPAVVAAPFDLCALVCPILIRIRNQFLGSPFYSLIARIINALLRRFGGNPSGG